MYKNKEFIRHSDNTQLCVLFIHGVLSSPSYFEKYIELLGEDAAVYAVLLEGHGGNVKDFGNASMKKWKHQVSETVDMLLEKYEKLVIVCHSMGSYFAVEQAVKHQERIKGLCLLQPALNIGIKPFALKYAFMVLFEIKKEDDEILKAYNDINSVTLTKKPWHYIKWIRRIFEIASESGKTRKNMSNLVMPCTVFISQNDEITPVKPDKHIPKCDNIKHHVLSKSTHFVYDNDDEKLIIEGILNLIK
ncbi:MAG: alpha/beta hydrolase [Ruminococcaceae bacterium]|nr:alpha/beta hydrolase [Oscillospiraceae bacterium]